MFSQSLDTQIVVFDHDFFTLLHLFLARLQDLLLVNQGLNVHLYLDLLSLRRHLLLLLSPDVLVQEIEVLCLLSELGLQVLVELFCVGLHLLDHSLSNLVVVLLHFSQILQDPR